MHWLIPLKRAAAKAVAEAAGGGLAAVVSPAVVNLAVANPAVSPAVANPAAASLATASC